MIGDDVIHRSMRRFSGTATPTTATTAECRPDYGLPGPDRLLLLLEQDLEAVDATRF
jgi:hypothetical protein